jgi:hypothetical protein
MHASGSSRRAIATLIQSPGMLLSGLVSSKSLPCLLPADALPDGACPPVGRLGLTAPPSAVLCAGTLRRYDCHRAPLGALRVSLASRYLACFRAFVVSLTGSCLGGSPEDHASACGHPVPLSGRSIRRQVALPRSRATPMAPCPALRPRWCPAHSPKRAQDCCLPVSGHRRLSSPYHLERYPFVHNYTHCGAQSHDLRPRDTWLRTATDGEARGFTTDRLARR